MEAIQHCRANHNRRAVLVVMENRNFHPLAEFLLDIETLGRFDVFQIDATESGLQGSNDIDQLVRIALFDLQIEHINIGEFFEQYALAFHHWLGGEWANRAQAQHCGAIGDHTDQICTGCERAGFTRVGNDFFAGEGNTRRISQG